MAPLLKPGQQGWFYHVTQSGPSGLGNVHGVQGAGGSPVSRGSGGTRRKQSVPNTVHTVGSGPAAPSGTRRAEPEPVPVSPPLLHLPAVCARPSLSLSDASSAAEAIHHILPVRTK